MSLIRLPKHYKETVISKPNAIANGLANAAQTATKFITEISNSGIWVTPDGAQPSESGSALPTTTGWHISDAIELFRQGSSYFKIWLENAVTKVRVGLESSGHLMLTPDGLDIFNGGESVAEFGGNGARIGKATGESHLELDYHSMQLIDKEGDAYFYVSDLRDSTGYATISAYFKGDGTTTAFNMLEWGYPQWFGISSVLSVSVDDVEMTYGVDYTNDAYGTVTFSVAPASGSQIVITYRSDRTSQQEMRAFTFGTRDDSSASGMSSISFGDNTTASGYYSFAQGYKSVAQGMYSHSEGYGQSEGLCAHSEGGGIRYNGRLRSYSRTKAIGDSSHAEGYSTRAAGTGSHAEGYNALAGGDYSHAQNVGTVAAYEAQTAIGKYNDNQSGNAFEVGNGTAVNVRSNAFTVAWDGTVTAAGEVTGASTELAVSLASGVTADVHAVRRSGKVVTVYVDGLNLAAELANHGTAAVATVPSGYRPAYTAYAQLSGWNQGGSYVTVGTNGTVTVSNQSGAAIPTTRELGFTLTYVR